MSRTLTVEADINAADTLTRLTAQGSVTAPSLVVPSGMKKISKIIGVVASDALADDGMYIFFVRLGGAAVLGGEQTIVMHGGGNQTVQTGSDAAPSIGVPFVLDDVDIAVSPSDVISISAELAGVDPGDTTVTVTVVFSK